MSPSWAIRLLPLHHPSLPLPIPKAIIDAPSWTISRLRSMTPLPLWQTLGRQMLSIPVACRPPQKSPCCFSSKEDTGVGPSSVALSAGPDPSLYRQGLTVLQEASKPGQILLKAALSPFVRLFQGPRLQTLSSRRVPASSSFPSAAARAPRPFP